MTWRVVIRLVLAALLLRRLGADAVKVRRGLIARTRLVIPAVILGAALLIANHLVPKAIAAAGFLAMDLALAFLCLGFVRAVRRCADCREMPEHRLERALLAFFPPAFAKFVSADITLLSHAIAGLKCFIDVEHHTPYSYIRGSKIAMAAVVMGAAIIPDAVFLWLLLPHRFWWLAALLDALDVWAFLWLLGLYGTMARRPHEVSANRVVLCNGILQTVEFDPKDIAEIRTVGVVKRRKLPRTRDDGSTVLAFGGVPLIDVELRRAAMERHLFFHEPREVRRIFVATDAPQALITELRQFQ